MENVIDLNRFHAVTVGQIEYIPYELYMWILCRPIV